MRQQFVTRPEHDPESAARAWLYLILATATLLGMLLLVGMAGCSDRRGAADRADSAVTSGADGGSAGGVAPAPAARAGAETPTRTVEVRLNEYSIQMPTTFTPGPITFRVMNAGTQPHGLEIKGNGDEQKLELNGGEIKMLTMTLTAGIYEVYCPIDGHADKGMRTKVAVQ